MKVLLSTTAAAAFLMASAVVSTPAMASGYDGCIWFWGAKYCPYVPPVEPDCPECVPGEININQMISGWQKAFNTIKDVNSATDVTQTAVNAANLVNLRITETTADDVVEPSIGTIEQTSTTWQWAANSIEGTSGSSLAEIVQSATNVVNSITAVEARFVDQSASGPQLATNYMVFGKGGYAGPEGLDLDLDDAVATQSAVNAANLVNLDTLNGTISQESSTFQTAINTAAYSTGYDKVWKGYGWHFVPANANVSDFAQSATNVANSITVGEITGIDCGCPGDEINQTAYAAQLASNSLYSTGSGLLNLNNIVQSATNVANSVGLPSGN